MSLIIFLVVTCAAVPAGAQFLRLTRLAPQALPERLLASATVGYVLIGYGTLTLGLTGHLTAWAVAAMLAGFAVAGLGNWNLLWEGVLTGLNFLLRAFRMPFYAPIAVVLLLIVAGTFITALEPPAGRDYDGLAEHLAQAAAYVRHAEVTPLWYDHHSQFPSNMQMLYSIALLYHSEGAAKLFHWFHGIMALVAVFLIARRFFGPQSCGPAALVLAVSPMFIWLMGVAYVDLAVMAYGLVAVLTFLKWQQGAKGQDLMLAGLMAGCGMTVKMQGAALFGILMLAALIMKPQLPQAFGRRLKWTVLAGIIGLMIALPWYVRSALNTGNPFYPFAYSIFGGRLWSADRALAYQRHQLEFGLGDLPPQQELDAMPAWQRFLSGPREPWKWLVAPFGLTFMPWEYEVNLGPLQNLLMTSVGPLWLALVPLVLLLRGRPRALSRLMWLFLPLWVWWFMSMQLGRYLLPTLVILAPVAGYAFVRYTRGGRTGSYFVVSAVSLASATALGILMLLVVPAVPVVFGLETRESYLMRNLEVYEPSAYIAMHTPPDARIATYGEVRTYHFQRDAFWAEYGHSSLIDYNNMKGPQDLIRRYHELGITHVLINQAYLPDLRTSQDTTMRLLREAMESGQLQLVRAFPLHRNYLLFAVAPGGGGA